MTDFGPLLANPKTLLLGAAALIPEFCHCARGVSIKQIGIIEFTLPQAAANRDYWWC